MRFNISVITDGASLWFIKLSCRREKCTMIQISALIKGAVRYRLQASVISKPPSALSVSHAAFLCLYLHYTHMPTHVHLSPLSYFGPEILFLSLE